MTRGHGRSGVQLVAILLVVLALAAIGLGLSTLANQAGKAGHWFHHSQLAHGLADAGLKVACAKLDQASRPTSIQALGTLATILQAVYTAATQGQAMSAAVLIDPASLPEPLTSQVNGLKEYNPKVTVTIEVVPGQPLWQGTPFGMPADPNERKGGIQLVSRAEVRTPAGIRVERTLTLERAYKVVNPRPPLLGRFVLFVQARGNDDPNFVPMKFDPNTGDSAYDNGPEPLLVESGPVAEAQISQAGGVFTLDRMRLLRKPATTPRFLDKQGWVYLGEKEWKLALAHGLSRGGETFHLPGLPGRELFKASSADDQTFRNTFESAVNAQPTTCQFTLQDPATGLHVFRHGFAQNYEVIGTQPWQVSNGIVQNGGSRTPEMDFGPGETSAFRLLGDSTLASPTLVFGPVRRLALRRAEIHADGSAFCPTTRVTFPLYKLTGQLPVTEGILLQAFGNAQNYSDWSTGVAEEDYAQSLATLLDVRTFGNYNPDGSLGQSSQTTPAQPLFDSQFLAWLGQVPQKDGLPAAAVTKLVKGDLDAPRIYKDNLTKGLAAFVEALKCKMTFVMSGQGAQTTLFRSDGLHVPGVVRVEDDPLVLPAVSKIVEGGIICGKGAVRISGNVTQGGTTEPLTIVSESADVTVDAGVSTIEAYLVAPNGKVTLSGPVTIKGGLACREFDLASIRTVRASRTLRFSTDLDPYQAPANTDVRVFYGGDELVAASGEY